MADISTSRGDTLAINLVITRPDPDPEAGGARVPVNLTGGKIWFTAKQKRTDIDTAAVIRKGSPGTTFSGISITDAAEGKAQIVIAPADTSDLPAYTFLFYDVQLLESTLVVTTVASGKLAIVPDVTQGS